MENLNPAYSKSVRRRSFPDWLFCIAAIASVLTVAEFAAASDITESGRHERDCQEGNTQTICCPGDYCAKPMPCIPRPRITSAQDDYDRRPLPCPARVNLTCHGDDYCGKPLPALRVPLTCQENCKANFCIESGQFNSCRRIDPRLENADAPTRCLTPEPQSLDDYCRKPLPQICRPSSTGSRSKQRFPCR